MAPTTGENSSAGKTPTSPNYTANGSKLESKASAPKPLKVTIELVEQEIVNRLVKFMRPGSQFLRPINGFGFTFGNRGSGQVVYKPSVPVKTLTDAQYLRSFASFSALERVRHASQMPFRISLGISALEKNGTSRELILGYLEAQLMRLCLAYTIAENAIEEAVKSMCGRIAESMPNGWSRIHLDRVRDKGIDEATFNAKLMVKNVFGLRVKKTDSKTITSFAFALHGNGSDGDHFWPRMYQTSTKRFNITEWMEQLENAEDQEVRSGYETDDEIKVEESSPSKKRKMMDK